MRKEAKKTLIPACVALKVPTPREAAQKFFGSFFQKRTACLPVAL
jgi:hypothetical protein